MSSRKNKRDYAVIGSLFLGIVALLITAMVSYTNELQATIASTEDLIAIIREINQQDIASKEKVLFALQSMEQELIKAREEQRLLKAENEALRNLIDTSFQDFQMVRKSNSGYYPSSLAPLMKEYLASRIRFIHSRSMPGRPLPEGVPERYAEWTYKYSEKYGIPFFFMAAIAETETNWVSRDSYDGGDSWTVFSIQIATLRDALMRLNYDIPHDNNANNFNLSQPDRYRNFVNQYKWQIFDSRLDTKELAFEAVAEHIAWLMKQYDGDLFQTALAYNQGRSYIDEVFANYPMNVMGRYLYMTERFEQYVFGK